MSNGNGHRWSKWWWADDRNDAALRMCCLAARGLWKEILGLMFEADGYLLVNGRQPSVRQLATLVGATEKEVAPLLAELEEAGVFSRTTEGTIYSRRMTRDAAASEQAKAWGSKGGNPSLKPKPNGGVNPPHNHRLNPGLNGGLNGGVGKGVKPEAKKEEVEEDPPRSPPRDRGGRRGAEKSQFRNAFRAMGGSREAAPTIEGTAQDAEDFQEFRLKIVGGADG